MDNLPPELLRQIFSYCDAPCVRVLREVSRTLSIVGLEYLLPPEFTALGYRDDIERLKNIAHHLQLRSSIESVVINFADVDDGDATKSTYFQHPLLHPEARQEALKRARGDYSRIKARRNRLALFHSRENDLHAAFSNLPNLTSVRVTFTECPHDNEIMRDVYGDPGCRKMDREAACLKLNTVISALRGIHLSSFSVDRFPLGLLSTSEYRRFWFDRAQSLESLTRLHLTLDPGGAPGPSSIYRAVNGLSRILQIPSQLQHLKLAFHPYSVEDHKFPVSFRELMHGFTYTQLTDLTLEGLSCAEEDLREFLARHGSTLTRLRLGGRGLAQPDQASKGGIKLSDGTFRSLFSRLRPQLPKLQRLHLEGICECEHFSLPSHETYNFYPLTNEEWQDKDRPDWVRGSRAINCLPFENYLLSGGPYPGTYLTQHNSF